MDSFTSTQTQNTKELIILCLTDLPEVRDGVRQGALGGDVGWHPGVVLNLKGGGGERLHRGEGQRSHWSETSCDRATAFFQETFLVYREHQIVTDLRLITGNLSKPMNDKRNATTTDRKSCLWVKHEISLRNKIYYGAGVDVVRA